MGASHIIIGSAGLTFKVHQAYARCGQVWACCKDQPRMQRRGGSQLKEAPRTSRLISHPQLIGRHQGS
ncbi:hypothetical protein PAXRUDRAFT_831352 [Paxillus rubicundulus Ve08.2h10]|uniref:Uncharacterized protein n=1 Tax=Paxillus rubicundulus Ve08.2h10 TaxID=930991 RepID=A0A0D0D2W4_9AGAM|nr:hypothetical protein PAXRUDRAFT_831352 [Paxillus rubicundulus Ve08.2h10]